MIDESASAARTRGLPSATYGRRVSPTIDRADGANADNADNADRADVAARKRALRRRLLSIRATRSDADRVAATAGLTRRLSTRLHRLGGLTVAAYAPAGDEPGSYEHLELLRSAGARVLLPITYSRDLPLEWGRYDGPEALVAGPYGLRQPAQASNRPLREADMVIVPALALSLRGARLGRGGGFYDRALAGVPQARVVGVVYDDELLDDLPTEPHDIGVGWVCTPRDLRRVVRRE